VLHPSVQNPFGVLLPNVIMRKLLSGHRPDFTRADAPSALRDLVARCLNHNPSKSPSMWEVQGAEGHPAAAASCDFAAYVMLRVRREASGVHINRKNCRREKLDFSS
jgi:hypothetical protein